MHLFDLEKRLMGGYAIVGGQLPLATGAGLAIVRKGERDAVVCQMGDATTNIGAFHESLNLAALWKLPVVYAVINNGFGMGTSVEAGSSIVALHEKACAYGIPGVEVDGNDVLTVRDAVREAVERARSERIPTLMNIKSFRLKGHSVVDPDRYRSDEYLREIRAQDPLAHLAERLKESGLMDDESLAQLDEDVDREVLAAVEFADESPEPNPDKLFEFSYATQVANQPGGSARSGSMGIVTYRQALHDALAEEMRRDSSVVLLGEEIGLFEGSYKITAGLLKEFGADRVMDTPIAEEGFVGAAIGAAMLGLRPVVEIMTVNFSLLALDQVVNHAAKIHYMFGGQARVPMVLRMPEGGGQQLAATHSQNFSAWYAYVPGLKVVAPATPADARGLLKAAIRDDDPVIFLENLALYNTKGEVPGPRRQQRVFQRQAGRGVRRSDWHGHGS